MREKAKDTIARLKQENAQLSSIETFARRLMSGRAIPAHERSFDVFTSPSVDHAVGPEHWIVRVYEPLRADAGWTVILDARDSTVISLGNTLDVQAGWRIAAQSNPYVAGVLSWIGAVQREEYVVRTINGGAR